jgi:hypothetical protein
MENVQEFEKALVEHLDGGSDKATLKDFTDTIVQLKKQGFIIDQILKKGIPIPVEFIVKCRIDKARASALNEFIFKGKYYGLEIFPYGIPWPEIFRVNITLNDNRIGI